MFKYFERYSPSCKTTIYYCQIDGWNYYCAEYRISRDYDETLMGCFFDDIDLDWGNWAEEKTLPKESENLPLHVEKIMIKYIFK